MCVFGGGGGGGGGGGYIYISEWSGWATLALGSG